MSRHDAPLVAALLNYVKKNNICYHVPGHRQGEAIPGEMRQLQKEIYKYDLTELPGLDDLHNPQEVIAEAQNLAAEAFNAKQSYFLVNGTSCGLIALILAVCSPNDTLIVPRNAHKSVMTGLILSGARPIYINPPVLKQFGILLPIMPKQLKHALNYHQAGGVLLVNPNYYGVAADLTQFADIAHQHNLPLLVDEAHGCHFHFSDRLPCDALAAGADAVVQSTHKVGGALTQASMLHLNSERIDKRRLKECLQMVQSTSPSYILMASLDAARRQLFSEGERLLEKSLDVAERLRNKLAALPQLTVLSRHHLTGYDILSLDETRLVINVRRTGMSGYQAAEILSAEYCIQVEMADDNNIVAVLGLNADEGEADRFYFALKDFTQRRQCSRETDVKIIQPPVPQQRLTPRQAWLAEKKPVSLEQAAGKISADTISVYPPGIPVVCPGEVITEYITEYLLDVRRQKLHVHAADETLKTVTVVWD